MDEYIARLHHSLEVLKLCVSLCKVSTDDAYFVKNARAKLVDASEHQRRIDELFKQYEEVKEREAKILTDLEVRVQLAECQRSFVESLPPKSQPSGVATQGSSLAAGDKALSPAGYRWIQARHEPHRSPKRRGILQRPQAIASKYELLALPKSRLKEAQWKRVAAYHTQETAETKRLSFVVDADLTGKSGGGAAFESSRVVTQFVVVMRHCGRIREIRGPERIVRYVVV
ncbi:hypothetical protein MRX96_042429 [Rhipicephalus microplus]